MPPQHETEYAAREASGVLMGAISELYIALSELERRAVADANSRMQVVNDMLRQATSLFDGIAVDAGPSPLSASEYHPNANELTELYARLEEYQYRMPLNSDDISRISAREIRLLAHVVERVVFEDSPNDWFIGREMIEAVNRMQTVGVITSRVSYLNSRRR